MPEWKKVATLADFEKDDRLFAEAGDQEIAVFKAADGALYAVSPWCTHQRVSMMNGWIEGAEITCPLHGARFDLKTGRHLCAPAPRPLQSFPLKVEDGAVFVQVD
jgi:3-phenylpropionate/trans-cinnamate dioxygenase ferredoxin component